MATTAQTITLGEFLQLPEEEPPREYFNGEVGEKVTAKGQHAKLQLRLAAKLEEYGTRDRQASTFTDLRATFGGASVVPDVSVYRCDRVPRLPSGKLANDFTEPPDIAVEIVSPGQSFTGVLRRSLWYISNGVQIALLIDPEEESVLALRPGQQPEIWSGSDRLSLDDTLPGFELTVSDLFSALW